MDTNPYNRVANTWIADATEELNAALDALTRPQVWPPRFVVYHLQQATEKALKAALIFGRTGRFEATHNLDLLVKALPNDVIARRNPTIRYDNRRPRWGTISDAHVVVLGCLEK